MTSEKKAESIQRQFQSQIGNISKLTLQLYDVFSDDTIMMNPYFMQEYIVQSMINRDLTNASSEALVQYLVEHDLYHRGGESDDHRLLNVVLPGGDAENRTWFKKLLPMFRKELHAKLDSMRFTPPPGTDKVYVGTHVPTKYRIEDRLDLKDAFLRFDDAFDGFATSKGSGPTDDLIRVVSLDSKVFRGRSMVYLTFPITYCHGISAEVVNIPLVQITFIDTNDPWRTMAVARYTFRSQSFPVLKLGSYALLMLFTDEKVLSTPHMHAAGFFAAFAYLYEVADQRATSVAQRLRVLEAWDIADEATAPKGEAFLREVSRRVVAAAESLSAATTHAEGYLPPLHRVHRAPQGLRPAQRVRVRGAYEAGLTYCALRGLEVANHVLEFDNGHFALPHFAFLLNLRHVYRATVDAIALSHTYGVEMSEVSFVTATVLENIY